MSKSFISDQSIIIIIPFYSISANNANAGEKRDSESNISVISLLSCSFFDRKPYRSMQHKETQSIEIQTVKEIFAVLIFKEEVLNKRSFTHF